LCNCASVWSYFTFKIFETRLSYDAYPYVMILWQVYKLKKHTEPPVSLRGQLLWREFFYTVSVCRNLPLGHGMAVQIYTECVLSPTPFECSLGRGPYS
jgi:hypothetical protein